MKDSPSSSASTRLRTGAATWSERGATRLSWTFPGTLRTSWVWRTTLRACFANAACRNSLSKPSPCPTRICVSCGRRWRGSPVPAHRRSPRTCPCPASGLRRTSSSTAFAVWIGRLTWLPTASQACASVNKRWSSWLTRHFLRRAASGSSWMQIAPQSASSNGRPRTRLLGCRRA